MSGTGFENDDADDSDYRNPVCFDRVLTGDEISQNGSFFGFVPAAVVFDSVSDYFTEVFRIAGRVLCDADF